MTIKYIYALAHPETNIPFYVGQTSTPDTRLNSHVGIAKRIRDKKGVIIMDILNSGLHPVMNILEEIEYESYYKCVVEANKQEGYWITELRSRGHDIVNRAVPTGMWLMGEDSDTYKYKNAGLELNVTILNEHLKSFIKKQSRIERLSEGTILYRLAMLGIDHYSTRFPNPDPITTFAKFLKPRT